MHSTSDRAQSADATRRESRRLLQANTDTVAARMQASVAAARAKAVYSGTSPKERVRAFYAQRAEGTNIDDFLAEHSGDEVALLDEITAEHGSAALAETDALARAAASRAAAEVDRRIRRRASDARTTRARRSMIAPKAPRLLSPPEPPRSRAPAPSPSSRRARRKESARGGERGATRGVAPSPARRAADAADLSDSMDEEDGGAVATAAASANDVAVVAELAEEERRLRRTEREVQGQLLSAEAKSQFASVKLQHATRADRAAAQRALAAKARKERELAQQRAAARFPRSPSPGSDLRSALSAPTSEEKREQRSARSAASAKRSAQRISTEAAAAERAARRAERHSNADELALLLQRSSTADSDVESDAAELASLRSRARTELEKLSSPSDRRGSEGSEGAVASQRGVTTAPRPRVGRSGRGGQSERRVAAMRARRAVPRRKVAADGSTSFRRGTYFGAAPFATPSPSSAKRAPSKRENSVAASPRPRSSVGGALRRAMADATQEKLCLLAEPVRARVPRLSVDAEATLLRQVEDFLRGEVDAVRSAFPPL